MILLMVWASHVVYSQIEVDREQIKTLSDKNVTYYWIGRSCPPLINTELKYGFKIVCKGSVLKGTYKRNNRKAIRKINQVYGSDWFEDLEDGWIVFINFHEHVKSEMQQIGIDHYVLMGGEMEDLEWRTHLRNQLFSKVSKIISQRLD